MMPSYSAADLRFPQKDLYMKWDDQYLCGKTPFDYIYAPTANEQHVTVSAAGSQYFENEIKCNVNDLPVFIDPSFGGPANLCTSATYSIISCKPLNTTITWNVQPANIVSYTTSGNNITLTKITDGNIVLTASLTNSCFGNITITKNINVGNPYATGVGYSVDGQEYPMLTVYPGSSPNEICLYKRVYPLITFGNATSVLWSRTTSASNIPWDNYNHSFYFFSPGQTLNLTATATNGCGSTSIYGNFEGKDCTGGIDPCGNMYTISPNPSDGEDITVETVETLNIPAPCLSIPRPGSKDIKSNFTISEVRIYDMFGTMRKYKKANKVKKLTLDTHGLLPGSYRVHISDGSYKEVHTLIISS